MATRCVCARGNAALRPDLQMVVAVDDPLGVAQRRQIGCEASGFGERNVLTKRLELSSLVGTRKLLQVQSSEQTRENVCTERKQLGRWAIQRVHMIIPGGGISLDGERMRKAFTGPINSSHSEPFEKRMPTGRMTAARFKGRVIGTASGTSIIAPKAMQPIRAWVAELHPLLAATNELRKHHCNH